MQRDDCWWGAALGASVVVALVFVVALTAAAGWNWTAEFLGGPAASWAQAVGTVAAIVYSGHIARIHISATRRWDERKRIEAERRYLVTVIALLAVPIGASRILKDEWDPSTHRIPTGFTENYWKEARISIAAIDPFACPEEEVIVSLVQVPHQLDKLIDAWIFYQKALRLGVPQTDMADDAGEVLDESIRFLDQTALKIAEAAHKRLLVLRDMDGQRLT